MRVRYPMASSAGWKSPARSARGQSYAAAVGGEDAGDVRALIFEEALFHRNRVGHAVGGDAVVAHDNLRRPGPRRRMPGRQRPPPISGSVASSPSRASPHVGHLWGPRYCSKPGRRFPPQPGAKLRAQVALQPRFGTTTAPRWPSWTRHGFTRSDFDIWRAQVLRYRFPACGPTINRRAGAPNRTPWSSRACRDRC